MSHPAKVQGPRPQWGRAASMLAAGATMARAATACEVSRRTIGRWARDPAFQTLLRRYRQRLVDQALGRLSKAATQAVAALATCLRSDVDAVKVRAALGILDQLIRVREHSQLAEDVAELQERLRTQGIS